MRPARRAGEHPLQLELEPRIGDHEVDRRLEQQPGDFREEVDVFRFETFGNERLKGPRRSGAALRE